MADETKKAIAQSQGHLVYGDGTAKPYVMGYYNPNAKNEKPYHETIRLCRYFYKYDPIASTVINRIADMAITKVRHKRKSYKNTGFVDDTTMAFYNAVAERLRSFLKAMAVEFLVHGMAVPSYKIGRIRGNLLAEQLGRKRVFYPEQIWIRNPENLTIKRRPFGMDRQVYLNIPPEDITFILSKGMRSDGANDPEGYAELVANFPEYVRAVEAGQTKFLIPDAKPIFRKLISWDDYPQPYLQGAIAALEHKAYLKSMDRTVAARTIQAVRHIKIGSDQYPADDDDIRKAQTSLANSGNDAVFNWFTPHVYEMKWIIPPFETLLSESKYNEPNADIFLALGFPRVLTTGETLRSNSSNSSIAVAGPQSTFTELQQSVVEWLRGLYEELAEKNGFTHIPEPYFAPITTADMNALVQYATEMQQGKNISRDTVAQLYGKTWEDEYWQIQSEEQILPTPDPIEQQREQLELQQEFQQKDEGEEEPTEENPQTDQPQE